MTAALEDDAARTPCTAKWARAWSTSRAGACRSTTARRSKSITACGATRACSTSRTCWRSTCEGAGARDFLRHVLANDVARLSARQGALQLHARGRRRRARRSHRVRARGRRFPARRQRGHGARRTSRGSSASARARRGCDDRAAARSRDRRGAGSARAGEILGRAARDARAATESLAQLRGGGRRRLFVARTGYTGEDGFEVMVPARRSGRAVARARRSRRRARGPRRARHAAARSGHESLRSGHGRDA